MNFSIQHDDHEGDSLEKFSKMINNVYKAIQAPEKLAKSLCIPGAYCISLFKDRYVRTLFKIFSLWFEVELSPLHNKSIRIASSIHLLNRIDYYCTSEFHFSF